VIATSALLGGRRRVPQRLAAPLKMPQSSLYLTAAWRVLPDLRGWIDQALPVIYREEFFDFCGEKLRNLDTDDAKAFLRLICSGGRPYGVENDRLIQGILRSPDAWE